MLNGHSKLLSEKPVQFWPDFEAQCAQRCKLVNNADMETENLVNVERTLTKTLLGWSAASMVLGTAIALAGKKRESKSLTEFGRQTAAWGAVDAVIAGAGLISQKRRGELTEEQTQEQARKLHKLLVINTIADVGYVAGGVALVSRGSRKKSTLRMGIGDGLAIVIQGAFLFVLDVSQASRLRKSLS